MTILKEAIDKAVKEQYPNGDVPRTFQVQYRSEVKQSEKNRWTSELDLQLKNAGINCVSEYKFHPERMWRFDRAIVSRKIAIEIDGGSFGRIVQCHRCHTSVMRVLKDGRSIPIREGGRHTTGSGQQADHEKFNAATILGWHVLRFTPKHIRDGYALNCIKLLIEKTVPS